MGCICGINLFYCFIIILVHGFVPDLATIRDRAKTKFRKMFYGLTSFGWTGSTKHWQRHESLGIGFGRFEQHRLYYLFIRLYLLTLPHQLFRAGIQLSFLLTLLRVLFSLALQWCKPFSLSHEKFCIWKIILLSDILKR